MLENLPLHSVRHKALTIEGYSRAAVQTYWRIPELKLGFDLGASPWSFMGTPKFFVSHGHLDHMAALPVYVARRRMMKMEPPVIYLPIEIVDPVWQMMRAWQRLDRGRMVCELVGVKEGDEITLSREHRVTVFATKHTVESVGYIVYDCRKKLKAEFQGLSGDQIRDIRLSGAEVTNETLTPLVCFTGDTSPKGLDGHPDVFNAQVLITEMTFFRPDHRKEKIHKFGHMHLDDILERADLFNNELIILSHLSTRTTETEARRRLKRALPPSLRERTILWESGISELSEDTGSAALI
ncbi:MAG: metal-dependent hydrolase [Planctomycetaceae bacterium]|nr:metal-dependent hydrolase [Planctomycetaceae bacterium]